jgi:methyl-accepting chemotaxis protein
MNGPGDMLTALDTKNMASDMRNGMQNVMPLLSMLREIPQVISNAVESTDNNTTSSNIQVGQDDSAEILKQISNKMEQFVSVASQIANSTEKTARNTDDIGDSVY